MQRVRVALVCGGSGHELRYNEAAHRHTPSLITEATDQKELSL